MPRYLVRPYTILAANREKPFGEGSEYAAVLCIADAKRKKGGVLGGSAEILQVFSKLYYPIWIFPWKGRSFFVDGLDISSCSLAIDKSIDVTSWIEEVSQETRRRSQYGNALERLFQSCRSERHQLEVSFKAILSEKNLLNFLLEPLKENQIEEGRIEAPPSLVKPILDERKAKEKAQLLIDRYEEALAEVNGLQYLMNMLRDGVAFHRKKAEREVKELAEKKDREILQLKPRVEEAVRQLKAERDNEIKKLTAAAEKNLEKINKKRERWEKELQKLEEQRQRYRARKKELKTRKSKVGINLLNKRVQGYTEKILKVDREARNCKKNAETVQSTLRKNVAEINARYELQIQKEEDKISSLKDQLEKERREREDEVNRLGLKTESIIERLNEQVSRKEAFKAKLEELTLESESEETKLLSIPFYFARYTTGNKDKLVLFPPTAVDDPKGLVNRLKRAIIGFGLEGRINLLLRPQSDDFNKLLATLEKRVAEDKALKEAMAEAGEANNLLLENNFHEKLASGLDELELEGWIGKEEKDLISKTYAVRNEVNVQSLEQGSIQR